MFTSNDTWTEQALFRDMYAYAHRYSHLITKKLVKRDTMSYRMRKGIWDILEEETETEKCYNYYVKKF